MKEQQECTTFSYSLLIAVLLTLAQPLSITSSVLLGWLGGGHARMLGGNQRYHQSYDSNITNDDGDGKRNSGCRHIIAQDASHRQVLLSGPTLLLL